MWPRTSSKIQDKDISLEIVDSKTGVGLRDELEDYDLIDEKKQKELNRAARVAVKNALTDVKLMVSDMGRETLAYQPSRHLN